MQPSRARTTSLLADERFYAVIFAAQRVPNWPRFSHTFATFVKATPGADPADGCRLESHTISWLPRTLDVALLRRRPEPGINLDLRSTLRWALRVRARIARWGPFQVDRQLFDRAVQQQERLAKGALEFKSLDGPFRPQLATNCIHAVSDIDRDHGLLSTGTRRGEGASALVALHFRRWIIDPGTTHEWVAQHLGLENYPILRRSFAPEALEWQVGLHERLLMSVHSLLCTFGSYWRRQVQLSQNALDRYLAEAKRGQLAVVPVTSSEARLTDRRV